MRFIWEGGHPRRKMHLCGYDPRTGEATMTALCGIDLPFNRSCNMPLGQKVCKRCRKVAS